MPYLFTCPHCQSKTQVEDRYSGQAGECVTCGGPIQLPQFASGVAPQPAIKSDSGSIRWVVASVVAVILLGCLVFALVQLGGDTMNRLSTNRERTSSIQNLEKIAAALNAYAADHGSYPPSATRDPKNVQVKLHSWRVLILPYLGEQELYNKFNLDLPWDDPANMNAAYEIPSVYRHPNGNSSGMYYESGYYLIVGQGTLFPTAGPMGPDQIIDDPSQTILVIEGTPLVPSGLWSEPLDMDFAKMTGSIGDNPGISPGGLLDDGAAMVTVDGRGHFLPDTIDPAIFRALVTPRGGERMADDTLD